MYKVNFKHPTLVCESAPAVFFSFSFVVTPDPDKSRFQCGFYSGPDAPT